MSRDWRLEESIPYTAVMITPEVAAGSAGGWLWRFLVQPCRHAQQPRLPADRASFLDGGRFAGIRFAWV